MRLAAAVAAHGLDLFVNNAILRHRAGVLHILKLDLAQAVVGLICNSCSAMTCFL